jgi:hypothetical protein
MTQSFKTADVIQKEARMIKRLSTIAVAAALLTASTASASAAAAATADDITGRDGCERATSTVQPSATSHHRLVGRLRDTNLHYASPQWFAYAAAWITSGCP